MIKINTTINCCRCQKLIDLLKFPCYLCGETDALCTDCFRQSNMVYDKDHAFFRSNERSRLWRSNLFTITTEDYQHE